MGIQRVLLSYKVREYYGIFLPLHQKEQVECVNTNKYSIRT